MLDASTSTRIHTHQRDTAPAHDRRLQPSGNRWFAIYSNPQAERRAADNLHQQNYQTYLPLVAVRRRDNAIRSLLHRVEVPLFPRYLFVSLNLRDPWTPILSTLGVRNLLRRPDGTPQPVAKGAIEALQALDGARLSLPAESAKWAPGAPVALRRGYALEGLPAVVLDVVGDQARIAVMFLGSLREITVSLGCLQARDDL